MLDTDTIERARVRRQRQRGVSWAQIAREVGMHAKTLRMRFDEDFAERTRERGRRRSKERYHGWAGMLRDDNRPDDSAAIRPPEQPDTRSLTARLCGDPPPGRSALDQRQGRAWWRG